MRKDAKKVFIDTVLYLVGYTLVAAAIITFICVFYAATNRALAIEGEAQRELIQEHKNWLNEVKTKD